MNCINSFFQISSKKDNDKFNKIRESIIQDIINNNIPIDYYQDSKWRLVKEQIYLYLNILHNKEQNIHNVSCENKAGRRNKFDFIFTINNNIKFNIEFKFNAKSIDKIPQFLSLPKPSEYLSSSYESFYYDNYLQKLCTEFSLELPQKDIYISTINTHSPKCVEHLKKHYKNNKEFKIKSKYYSKESIQLFITQNNININKLHKKLEEQKNKHYMLYHKNKFYYDTIPDLSLINNNIEIKKNKSSYILSNSKFSLDVLLRWKNNNGIAFPALQIKYKKIY